MTAPDPIDRYIARTRINCTERINREYYDQLCVEALEPYAKQFGLNLGFRLVYTPSRRAERVRIDGQNWLIYDQYLGQTLNVLNRLYFEQRGETPTIVYFHKYVAERALELGCPLFGVHCANFYKEMQEELAIRGHDVQLREAYTAMGERFAIYHELGQELLALGGPFPEMFKELVADALAEQRRTAVEQTAESLIEQFRASDSAAYHQGSLEELIADIRNRAESDEWRLERESYIAAIDDPETAAELFCDFVAAELVLADAGLQDENIDLTTRLRALYVNSYHLKTLAFFDASLDRILLQRVGWSDLRISYSRRMQAMQVRNHCLKIHLLFMYRARLEQDVAIDAAKKTEALGIELMKDQRRYFECIFDPASSLLGLFGDLTRVEEFERDVLNTMLQADARLDREEEAGRRAGLATLTVLMQTNWPPTMFERVVPRWVVQ